MTFEDFMKRVDNVIIKETGLSYLDFCDAQWTDLWEETDDGEDCSDESICETLADADDIYARMHYGE
ncbi:hypothetical protein [Caulobacter phage Cr30]|uniref:hypothetical protein n=1 Tax=Caulobacter phage Cr30 TaxID=1357714 RepID=UPI0004A9B855|nr:hypothetical protein OZ74_gp038 [Caulobacter phage Cr30]AGS80923.1 hypothetical protein [Caulobacter phage Cr30]